MTTTRIGIIADPGKLAQLRQAVTNHDQVRLVANSSPDRDLPAEFSKDALDAVIISAPLAYQVHLVASALEKQLHVLSTVPAGRSVEDMINIRRAEANAPDTVLQFGFHHRKHLSVQAAKRIFDTGDLGQLIHMRGLYGGATPLEGQPPLLEQGLHMLDLMQMFAGPFEEVQAVIGEALSAHYGVEDNVMAVLRTNAGAMSSLHISTTQWRQTFRLELGFERGYLWLDGLLTPEVGYAPEMLIIGRGESDENGCPLPNPSEDVQAFEQDPSWEYVLDDFIDAINGKSIASGTSLQAFDAMNIVQRIYAADHSFVPR